MGLKKWLKGFKKNDSDWFVESFKEEQVKTTSVPETFHLKESSPFGYKTTWFALYTNDIEGVAVTLKAADLSTIAMVKNDWLLLQTNSENMVDYNHIVPIK